MRNVVFENNQGHINGGNGKVSLVDCLIADNDDDSSIYTDGALLVRRSIIRDNGGSVTGYRSVKIDSSTVVGNRYGVFAERTLRVRDSQISDNGQAGLVTLDRAKIKDSVVTGNTQLGVWAGRLSATRSTLTGNGLATVGSAPTFCAS